MWTKPGHQPPPPPEPPAEKGTRLATFDRGQGKELRVNLDHYEGHPFISLRVWEKGWPTKSGTSLRFRELPELIRVLEQFDEDEGQGTAHPPASAPREQPASSRPPWEGEERKPGPATKNEERPLFVEKNRRPGRVDPDKSYPTPEAGERPFDEFDGN